MFPLGLGSGNLLIDKWSSYSMKLLYRLSFLKRILRMRKQVLYEKERTLVTSSESWGPGTTKGDDLEQPPTNSDIAIATRVCCLKCSNNSLLYYDSKRKISGNNSWILDLKLKNSMLKYWIFNLESHLIAMGFRHQILYISISVS